MRITKRSSGFTLVEVLLISPVVILVIGVFIGLAVSVTGESLRLRESNAVAFEVQNALDMIEDDAYKAVSFPRTIDTGQYSYAIAAQFMHKSTASQQLTPVTSSNKTLIIKAGATTANPADPARKLAHYVPIGTACTVSNLSTYPYRPVLYAYFVDASGTLWRRVIMSSEPAGNVMCPSTAAIWQKASCHPDDFANPTYNGISPNTGPCKAEDSRILDNVTQMTVKFYSAPGDANEAPWTWSEQDPPSTVNVSITVSKSNGGETITNTASTRTTSLNIK